MVGSNMSDFEKIFVQHKAIIEDWFQKQWLEHPPLINSSIDLRYAGFKVSPVDTNVFPAGFNNLDLSVLPLCIETLQRNIKKYHPDCKKIIIIPEDHTRNIFYFENLAVLYESFQKAGYDTMIASLALHQKTRTIHLPSGKTLKLEPYVLSDMNESQLKNTLIILNNDLSDGIAEVLKSKISFITPSLHMGWCERRKTAHFTLYEHLTKELAGYLDIDSWLMCPLFTHCDTPLFLNLKNHPESETMLINKISDILDKIQKKYNQYNIEQKPFVVIKSNKGTYGMSVIMIDNPQAILTLNRKQRTSMSFGKGKQPVDSIIIQEGVPTIEQYNHFHCESVLYSLYDTVVGGFYRVHPQKNGMENLNTPGMQFTPFSPVPYMYSVIARLAHLAATLENERVSHD